MIVGVISDTHGVLSKDALSALKGVGHILHAGDVGGQHVIKALEEIAPVTAVRGNMDGGPWGDHLPPVELIALQDVCFYVLHNLDALDLEPRSAGIHVVVSGHTHLPEIKTQREVIYFNPGSASYGRYGGPLTLGKIRVVNGRPHPEIIQLVP